MSERERELEEALRLFISAAYPVAEAINPRGHNWSDAYLEQALENAKQLLSPPPESAAHRKEQK